ncbi:OLC1v1037183C1 [Oldenlandia corymbosa var. corymbosa]|uniref:OLC1v1037183C1 n=1 Tax=Oldenlandia corymbosa var. corymbosa TaxID=529605 RepID=A0AAV1D0C4_OLDCO|nr:OLC1v1037183C1 [Oldenlandia corymbosa var. corymbosa]
MESHRNFTTNAVGFFLLPSELIQYIILRLALPEVVRLKSVNKSISYMIADQDFVRDYNHQSRSSTWLFVYKKRWHRDSMLHGYTDCSVNRWFKIVIADMLKPVVPPGEDLYLLTASGNFFLFALNNSREVISVNPMSRTVRKIPPSPLGPRGTSSWRRSGMKLISCAHNSDHFRFLFAEMIGNQSVLFEYDSETDLWTSTEVEESDGGGGGSGGIRRVESSSHKKTIFLSAYNGRSGSVVIAKGTDYATPVVLRPRFAGLGSDDNDRGAPLAVGFSWGNAIDRLHVYGDGSVMIVKSCDVLNPNRRLIRMLIGIELWGLSSRGEGNHQWELVSKVPIGLVEKIRKPYGAMMGCMEQRFGVVRAALMSNLEGVWDIIWLCYDLECKTWNWVPIPDCKMKGANMAGIAFSFGLTLS